MECDEEVDLLKCVANSTRLNILKLLDERGEMCVSEIIDELNEEQSLISHHLKGIRGCGLVEKRRDGRKIVYRLSDPDISDFLDQVESLSTRFCNVE